MKKNVITTLFFFLLSCSVRLMAQNGCETPSCVYAGYYNLSTGYSFGTSSYLTPLALEQNWELIQVPSNASVGFPPPVWVIPSMWNNFTNAKWLSPFQSNSYSINNWPPNLYGSFKFENCFCVCNDGWVNIQFDLMCDDAAIATLDGSTPLGSATTGNHFIYANRMIVNQNVYLTAGQHCIVVDLFNGAGGGFGLSVEGAVLANGLQKSECCDPTGKICGTKFNDLNCDGSVNFYNDIALPGWTIVLKDGNGNIIGTTTTDAQGTYCFDNLAAGNYTVSEVLNQPGWVQTYPGGAGTHSVSISAGDAVIANFGNCNPYINENPCNMPIDFTYEVNKCGVTFNTPPMYFGPGTYLVATNWSFGDGTNSTEANPVHYYSAPGAYNVCLSYTYLTPSGCCTQEKCIHINVDEACEGGCDIDANFIDTVDSAACIYTFSGIVNSTGTPITDWFWTFGDGSTGSGSTVMHHYLNSGTYQVCLTLFGETEPDDDGNRGCCFEKICREIIVVCDPCDKDPDQGMIKMNPPAGKNEGNEVPDAHRQRQTVINDIQMIVLNQNMPNPFNESTIITYSVPVSFKSAQILFTDSDGKPINTFNIPRKGDGQLTVFANDLSSGKYTYTLVVDGRIIHSKQMIKY